MFLPNSIIVYLTGDTPLYSPLYPGIDLSEHTRLDAATTRYTTLKNSFKKYRFDLFKRPNVETNHPHPISAAERNWASCALDSFLALNHRIPYCLSTSVGEQHDGRAGSRIFFTAADLNQTFQHDPLLPDHVFKLVDVDYYTEFSDLLSLGHSCILYTFSPNRVAGATKNETIYTCGSDDRFTLRAPPGATYHHHLWDHARDYVHADSLEDGTRHYYTVSRVRLPDSEHEIVLYDLTASVPKPRSWWYVRSYTRPSPGRVTRRIVSGKAFNVLHAFHAGVAVTSIARPNSLYEVSVPTVILDSLKELYHCTPKLFLPSTVSVILRNNGFDSKFIANSTALIHSYVLSHDGGNEIRMLAPNLVNFYPLIDSELPNLDNSKGRQIHPPLDVGGGIVAVNEQTEETTYRDRLKDFQPSKPVPFPHPELLDEFIHHFITPLQPLTVDQVYEQQNRPSQRAANIKNDPTNSLGGINLKSFGKVEVIAQGAATRNILTVDPDHRINYSRYTLPLSKSLLRFPWSAFGKAPLDICTRVQELSQSFDLDATDFSKFDARHGSAFCQLEAAVLRAAYPDDSYVLVLQDREIGARFTSKRGERINLGHGRVTGSPGTSVMNTLCNAYLNYVTLRLHNFPIDEAPKLMGIFGGDDGVIFRLPSQHVIDVAKLYEADLKVEPCHVSVPFLGRIYLDPKTTLASIYDVTRFVKKAHLTTAPMNITLEEAAHRKLNGLLVTDSETPIIREWIAYVQRVHGAPKNSHIDDYFARQILEKSWAPFPQLHHTDPLVLELVMTLVPNALEIIAALNSGKIVVNTYKELDPKIPVVFGGVEHHPIKILTPITNISSFTPTVGALPISLAKIPSLSSKTKNLKTNKQNKTEKQNKNLPFPPPLIRQNAINSLSSHISRTASHSKTNHPSKTRQEWRKTKPQPTSQPVASVKANDE